MSEWSWVALGYTVTYGAVLGYVIVLLRRRAAVQTEREKQR